MTSDKNLSSTKEKDDSASKKGSAKENSENEHSAKAQPSASQNIPPSTDVSPQTTNAKAAKKRRSLGSLLGFDEIRSTFKRTREQNKNVKKYAIAGVILALCSVALVWPCFQGGMGIIDYLINSLFSGISGSTGGNIVLVILIGVIASAVLGVIGIFVLLLPAVLALFSLALPIFQLILNRRWWSWVSLAVGLASVAACILLTFHLLQNGL